MCSESRVTDKLHKNEYSIEHYKVIECFSQTRSTGGVIIYIKNDIKYKVIANEIVDKMIWFLSIEIWNSEIDGIYTVFYRSPNKDVNIENALNALDELLNKSINLNKMNVITGDLNVDLNKRNKYVKMAKNIFVKHELKLSANFVTRENNRHGTLIDVIATNRNEQIKCKAIESEIISDHKTINIEINKISAPSNRTVNIISWKHYSKECLLMDLSQCDWSKFNYLSINEKVELIRENLIGSVLPMTKMIPIKNEINPKRWFDSEIKLLKIDKVSKYMEWLNN